MFGTDLNFNKADLTDHEMADLLYECSMDTALYSKVFFPEVFNMPWTYIHKGILDVIDARNPDGSIKHKKIVITAPRGIGKTSLVGEGLTSKSIGFGLVPFMYYVGSTATHAIAESENIKMAMQSSLLHKQSFGDFMVPPIGASTEFSKEGWVAHSQVGYKQTRVLPRGSGQQVRGLRFMHHRPSLFVIDDFEDAEAIMNDEIRDKNWKWLLSDLFEAKSSYSDDYQFIYIDTLKHEDSCLARLHKHPEWTSLSFSICDEDYNSLIPEFVSTEKIKAEVESHRELGTLDIFAQEKMGQAISKEGALFTPNMFKDYDEQSEEFQEALNMGRIRNVIIFDPAKKEAGKGADNAIVCWGVDTYNGRLYLRDVDNGRWAPSEAQRRCLDMAQLYRTMHVVVEASGLDDYIKHPMQNLASLRDQVVDFIWVYGKRGSGKTSGKILRIGALEPSYRKGLIYHNKRIGAKIELQLLSFPRSKKLDIMDAAAYIVEVLEMGMVYFFSNEATEYGSLEEIEEEYETLRELDDDAFIGAKRI